MSSVPPTAVPKQEASAAGIAPKQESSTAGTTPKQELSVAPKQEPSVALAPAKQPSNPDTTVAEPAKTAKVSPIYDPVGSTLNTGHHSHGIFPPHSWEQRKHEEQLPHANKLAHPATNAVGRAMARQQAEREGKPYDYEAAAAEERAEREKPGPGLLPRQPSYKYDDVKAARMEQYLARTPTGYGYTKTYTIPKDSDDSKK